MEHFGVILRFNYMPATFTAVTARRSRPSIFVWNWQHSDLSSKQINYIEGPNTVTKPHPLSLSCGLITRSEGLEALINLARQDLSCNQGDLSGSVPLRGLTCKLRHTVLPSNCTDSTQHRLQCRVGLHFWANRILEEDGGDNPVLSFTRIIEVGEDNADQTAVPRV